MAEFAKNSNANINTFFKSDLLKGELSNIQKLPELSNIEDVSRYHFQVRANSTQDIERTCNEIDLILKEFNISKAKRVDFCIALIEAINNAQQHGYQFAENKNINVNLFKIGNNYFLVGINSVGQPIPLNKVRELLRQDQVLKPGITTGRGFTLMSKTVDVVYVSHFSIYTEIFLGIINDKEIKN